MKPGSLNHRNVLVGRTFLVVLMLFMINCSRSEESAIVPGADINTLFTSANLIPQSDEITVNLFRFYLESVTVENEYTLLLRFNKPVDSTSGNVSSNFTVYTNDAGNLSLPVYGSLTSGNLVRVYTQTQTQETEYRVELSGIYCDGCSTQTAELKSSGVNIFTGWSFRVTSASFETKSQILLNLSSAVSCSMLQNTANYSVNGINPQSTLVDDGCSTQASSVRLNFSQPFSAGDYTLIISETYESANSLQLSSRNYNLSLQKPQFYLISALPASANSVILKFSRELITTGFSLTEYRLGDAVPDSVNIEHDYIVISSTQVTMSADNIYMVTFNGVGNQEDSARISGKIGVPGPDTLQVTSVISPDFGRFNLFSGTAIDAGIATDILNFPGNCSLQSSMADADGSVCGSAGKCIRFNHNAPGNSCTFSIANMKSASGRNIFLEQSGRILLMLNTSLSGAGQISFAGRALNYSTDNNRVFNIETGYLSVGTHSLTFSGFLHDNKPLSQETVSFTIP